MRNNPEYQLAKAVSIYLKLQYPNILYHFDLGGYNLSKSAAGMNKAIQKEPGFPDLFIIRPEVSHDSLYSKCHYHGLFIELKADGVKLSNKKGEPATDHLRIQWEYIKKLRNLGYKAEFAVGINEAIRIIDNYLQDSNLLKK
jgi:hypothetical protein